MKNLRYFIYGFVLAAMLSTTYGYATKEQEAVPVLTTQKSKDVVKVKAYYKKYNPRLWDSLAEEMAEATVTAAKQYKVPLSIQVGVNIKESEVHPFAVSRTGAKGMGQVDFDANREELGSGNPFEPLYNQQCSAYLLQQKIKQYGVNKGLEIYNVGEGNYKRGTRNPSYVRKVLSYANKFKSFKES